MFRWGIIGAGNIARRMAQALAMTEGAHRYAVASRTLEKAERFAADYGFEKAYGSYDALYCDPQVDIVYIATPHSEHAACALRAMEAGKHVLCEKPMTVNAVQCRALMQCAEQNGVFLMEALWTRFLPLRAAVDEAIASGKIGKVQSVYCDFSARVAVNDMNCRLSNPALAGGALLDLGVYPINIAAMYLGSEPSEIHSCAALSPAGVDMNDSISLLYPDGQTALLRTSLLFDGLRDASIDGERGTIRLPNFIVFDKAEVTADGTTRLLHYPYKNGFQYEAAHVQTCISEGKRESGVMPLSETLAITEIMDKLRAAWGLVYPFEKETVK